MHGHLEFGLTWTPQQQEFTARGLRFLHEGQTPTFPSHDLAHLLIAAMPALEWHPTGEDAAVRLAEYNAVFLETMLSKVFYNVLRKFEFKPDLLSSSLKYLRWFVYKHYAPFPIPAEEAYCRFCCAIDADTLVRLSIHYFDLRLKEHDCSTFKQQDWALSFWADGHPPATEFTAQCQTVFETLIKSIARPQFSCAALP